MAGCFCFAGRGIFSPRLRTIIGNEQGRAASFRRGESVVSAIFGTDGIRGRVPGELNASLAFRLGFSVGSMLWEETETRPRVAVGQDPRSSSDMLEAAVVAGVCASGADAERLSVIPTPAISWYTRSHGLQAGIMISASHNLYAYNGIKCFTHEGRKLSERQEQRLQEQIGRTPAERELTRPVGQMIPLTADPVREYTDYLSGCVQTDLSRIRVLFDCANGAAAATVPRLIRCLDLNADLIFSAPDGENINQNCGSTCPERLGEAVRRDGYDIGFALDGDADRCIAVDETGAVMDGDRILLAVASHWASCGRLPERAVTATVMSNLGLRESAQAHGIAVHTAEVGDSRVMRMMEQNGCRLGGEPSGHLIFRDYSMTGDGQLTAILLLETMAETGSSASALRSMLHPWVQRMENLPVSGAQKHRLLGRSSVLQAAERAREELDGGRIVLRASGTEDLIRILAEGRDADSVACTMRTLTDAIRREAASCPDN